MSAQVLTDLKAIEDCHDKLTKRGVDVDVQLDKNKEIKLFLLALSAWDLFVNSEQPATKDERLRDYRALAASTPAASNFPKKLSDLAIKWRDGEDIRKKFP